MKCRIFKMEDGSVVYDFPSEKYQDKIEACKIPQHLQGKPFIVSDQSEIPISESATGDYHEMIYFDGECTKENLKQDKEWAVQLMPDFLIKQKRVKMLVEELDAKLENSVSDPVEILITQRDLEKCKAEKCPIKHKEWALEGLDRRVANGEPDKPLIRQKLLQKIQELEDENEA